MIHATYEYVALHGKRDFADVVKLRAWGWGDDPGMAPMKLPALEMEGLALSHGK